MKKSVLLCIWGGLALVCMLLGLLPNPQGVLKILMGILQVLFFIPAFLLLLQARREEDKKTVKLITVLSAASLGGTTLLMILNFPAAFWPGWLGTALQFILAVCSVPMYCGSFALSLFLWACLLFTALSRAPKSLS